jgi:hypothetical protein
MVSNAATSGSGKEHHHLYLLFFAKKIDEKMIEINQIKKRFYQGCSCFPFFPLSHYYFDENKTIAPRHSG